jgi:hydroxyethylthiazole kinase
MIDASTLWPLVLRLRERAPLVQCITNFVAMDVTANVLLAAGASPAMVHSKEESADFVELGGMLSINIGTPSTDWFAGIESAVAAARRRGTPWVLDPVAVGATRFRDQLIARLLPLGPAVIRGNAGEIMTMAGRRDVVSKGVDSTQSAPSARTAAIELAGRVRCTVVTTGSVDLVTDGSRVVGLGNGHPLMTKVTALGCALSALVAAFLAVSDDPVPAAAAATAYFGICGELAAESAQGPGSLRSRLLDCLYALDGETFAGRLRLLE